MHYHIDGKKLVEWSKDRITGKNVKHAPSALARFFCNLVFTFIPNGYVGQGRIETKKTRYGIRIYLANKDKPTRLSGGLCNGYIADLVECGLAFMDDDKVGLVVPEQLINKGQLENVIKAIRVIAYHGWSYLSEEHLKSHGVSLEDCVEALFAIEQLLPADQGSTKDRIRERLKKELETNRQAA
jgi:hypothetical protein